MSGAPRGLFVIPSLRCGGAERVFTLLLNRLAARGFDMHVALCQKEGVWLERLSSSVTVHDLRSPRVRQSGWPLVKLVRSLTPAAVLSTSSHLNTVTGLWRPLFPKSTRVVLREVSINHFEPSYLRGIRGTLMRRAYQSADAVVALADGMRDMVHTRLGTPTERVVRIFNPLDLDGTECPRRPRELRTTSNAKRVLGVGSLTLPKGFDRLIAAFPSLLRSFPGSTLTIVGEGDQRSALEQQIASLGLTSRIHLPGFAADVKVRLAEADLFVLPSRFEGMPNALLEAIGERCPYVMLDHPGGSREIMTLLGQQSRITSSLDEWRPEWFEPISETTRELAQTHFGLESIVDQYQELLFPGARCERRAA